ncbi:MAG: FeoC-like transcriptional regulator [Anaerolineae bacterium]|jgi:hypothetical protein
MLNQLLELLQEGGSYRLTDLARRLDTTPRLVEIMLEDLHRLGYLKPVSGECAGECGGCSLTGLCAAGQGGRVWILTEKGGKVGRIGGLAE